MRAQTVSVFARIAFETRFSGVIHIGVHSAGEIIYRVSAGIGDVAQ